MRLISAGQTDPVKRQVYWHLVAPDGVTPVLTEGGGQPEISVNGGPWAPGGVSALAAIGHGRYYAVLDAATVASPGQEIETRYKSGATAECPGDSALVVGFDPDDPEAVLDLVDGVEEGVSIRQALRILSAAIAGRRSGLGTGRARYDAVGNPGTTRIALIDLDDCGNGEPTLTP